MLLYSLAYLKNIYSVSCVIISVVWPIVPTLFQEIAEYFFIASLATKNGLALKKKSTGLLLAHIRVHMYKIEKDLCGTNFTKKYIISITQIKRSPLH